MIHITEIQRHSIQPNIHTEFRYGREGRCSFTSTAASDLWDLVVPGQTCRDGKHGSDIKTGMSSSWSIRVCDHGIFFYRFLYVKLIGEKNPAESIPLLGLGKLQTIGILTENKVSAVYSNLLFGFQALQKVYQPALPDVWSQFSLLHRLSFFTISKFAILAVLKTES